MLFEFGGTLMNNNIIEIKRFLKDNKLLIGISTIIFTMLFAVGMTFFSGKSENVEPDGLNQSIGETKKAFFEIYIENEDGTIFNNNNLLTSYFTKESFIDNIAEETGVNIDDVNEKLKELGIQEQVQPIHAFRNNSGTITVSIRTGNEKKNLEVATFIFNKLTDGSIDFLNNKGVYEFKEPQFIEDVEEDTEVAQINQSIQSNRSFTAVVKYVSAGFFVGLVISIGITFVKTMLSKHLNYSFNYHINENHQFMLFDKYLSSDKHLVRFIGLPYKKTKVIISENSIPESFMRAINNDSEITINNIKENKMSLVTRESIAELDIDNDFSEIIILINSNHTTRKWYQMQKLLVDYYMIPVKIVQINE